MNARLARAGSLPVLAAAFALAGGANAATIEVADGVVEVALDGQCSLIEALENANGDALHTDCPAGDEGLDTVLLAVDSVYTLSEAHNEDDWPGGHNGLPSISTPIVVRGQGATIKRSADDDAPEFRLIHVGYDGDLTLEELSLRNGRASGVWSSGGAIANLGRLTVTRGTLENNSAGGGGGGIYSEGDAVITGTILSRNRGGINIIHGDVVIGYSTLFDNGVSCLDGSLTLFDSTVSGSSGRGIYSEGCDFSLLNSTLSGNSGGGLWVQKQPTALTNTIIAGSTDQDCDLDKVTIDFHGVNLIEDGSCGCTPPSCISGDPLLGELADNGGSTPTHALLAGSIAIDKGGDRECPETDQRGVLRGIDGAGDGSGEDLDGGCDIGAFEAGGSVARALVVDPVPADSDGNGVFEPQERAIVAPTWQNGGVVTRALAGKASDFAGPAGPAYEIVGEDADYGDLAPAQEASCRDTGLCYEMEIDATGGGRPVTHWDTTFEETVADEPAKTWTLHIGDSFADVPRTSPFYPSIEVLLHRGITAGCGDGEYCPANPVTRMTTALLVLKAGGRRHTPPACEQGEGWFLDVPYDSPFCPWIEELARRGVTSGCGYRAYCPAAPITRAQTAVLLLRTLEGAGYTPPTCTGVFGDVPCPSLFANWIEDLVHRGITAGCGGGNYCPANPVSRDQMAVLLSKTFSLTLYEP